MNGIYEKVEITETNIEEMSRLAEDVMHQLYMNYQDYDADGRDIFTKYYNTEEDYEKDIHPLIQTEMKTLLNDPNAHLLYYLFRRGDDISHVRYYTKEDIIPWIEPIIPKALNLFRKGTNECGDTNFVAAKSVTDDCLIAAFAREVRNMMMIFAGQKLHEEGILRYLLLLENPCCHDGDEWRGIYFDDQNLRRAFELVSSELEELKKNDKYYRSFSVGIWEFRPIISYDVDANGEKKVKFSDDGIGGVRQKIRRVSLEELQCYKEK